MNCVVTYKNKEYSYDNWLQELHNGLYDELVSQGKIDPSRFKVAVAEAPVAATKLSPIKSLVGDAIVISMPDGSELTGQYVIAAVSDVHASHIPSSGFAKDPLFPVDDKGNTVNDRDYEKDKAAQVAAWSYIEKPNPLKLLDTSASPSLGPPIIDANGVVISGNNRQMVLAEMSYADYLKYYTAMQFMAERTGLALPPYDSEAPRIAIYRKLDAPVEYSKSSLARFNEAEGKAKSDIDIALSFGDQLNSKSRAKELIFGALSQFDTIGQFFADGKTTRLVRQIMINEGIISEKDVNRFFEQDGEWSDGGKIIFTKGLFATLFDEDIVRSAGSPGMSDFMDKVLREVPSLSANFLFSEIYNIRDDIQNAIRFQAAFAASPYSKVDEYVSQATLFDAPSATALAMFHLINGSNMRSNYFRNFINAINTSATEAESPNQSFAFDEVQAINSRAEVYKLIDKIVGDEKTRQRIKDALDDGGYGYSAQEPISPYSKSNGGAGPQRGTGRLQATSTVDTERALAEAINGYVKEGGPDPFNYNFAGRPPKGTIAYVAALYNMNTFGFIEYKNVMSVSKMEKDLKAVVPGLNLTIAKASNGNYYLKINGKRFNPFDAKYNTNGKSKEVLPAAKIEVREEGLTPDSKQVQQLQMNFEEMLPTETASIPGGGAISYSSALQVMEDMVNMTDAEKEYLSIVNDYASKEWPQAVKQKARQLEQQIGAERAMQILKPLAQRLAEQKLGRPLAIGEYFPRVAKVSVSSQYTTNGKIKVSSPADVARIASFIENDNVENSVLFITDKDGKSFIVHLNSGASYATLVDTTKIASVLKAFNAESFYFIHNHPSGSMKPSEQDVKITNDIRNQVNDLYPEATFAGHIIIDFIDQTYTLLDNQGTEEFRGFEYENQSSEEGIADYPVYNLNYDALYNYSKMPLISSADDISNFLSSLRAGQTAKSGAVILNLAGKVVGHIYFDGNNNQETLRRAVLASEGAASVVLYGTSNLPDPAMMQSIGKVKIVDYVTYKSNLFQSSDALPLPNAFPSVMQMPGVMEDMMPYTKDGSKLEQEVQRLMMNGTLTIEDLALELYSGFYNYDSGKISKDISKIKQAYDVLSLSNEEWFDKVSSIDELEAFNIDNFIADLIKEAPKDSITLKQQYSDFANWFEFNYPNSAGYYEVELDSFGSAVIKVNGQEVVKYSEWISNRAAQSQWAEKRKLVTERPQMITLDKDLIPEPPKRVIDGQYEIFEDQLLAVNMMLERFIGKNQRGFMLGDGMGVGKTRTELVTAVEMAKAKGKQVIIITKARNTVDVFKREQEALGLKNVTYMVDGDTTGDVVIGTYDDVSRKKFDLTKNYAAVILDEAHSIKNAFTARSKATEELLQQSEHVVFATGTPMDKPVQMFYFLRNIDEQGVDNILKEVGAVIDGGKIKITQEQLDKDNSGNKKKINELKALVLRLRDKLVADGAYLRREYPYFGSAIKTNILLPEYAEESLDEIKDNPDVPRRIGIMEANRYQEHLKIPFVLDQTLRALSEGKQVVVFCWGVNPTEIKSLGITVPQFANAFADELRKRGIKFAEIYGENGARKSEEAKRFQRGEVKVAVATITSGGTGIDLDDQRGDAPREVIFATMPWSANDFDQAKYRTSRRNTKTPSRMNIIIAANSWADAHKEDLVDKKLHILRGIQAGLDPDVLDVQNWNTDEDGNIVDVETEDAETGGVINAENIDTLVVAPIEPVVSANMVSSEPVGADQVAASAVPTLPAITVTAEEVDNQSVTQINNKQNAAAPFGTSPNAVGKAPTVSLQRKGKRGGPSLGQSKGPITPPTAPKWSLLTWLRDTFLGAAGPQSLAARVVDILIKLGVPTTGTFPIGKKALGYYSHLPQDIKMKLPSDIFVAIHEGMHWIDFSHMGGLTNKIISSSDAKLRNELAAIYLKYYPGAKKTAPLETQIAEGLTMYMQMRLYDPYFGNDYPTVRDMVFTNGGKYYSPKMDEMYNAFKALRDELLSASPEALISMRLATPIRQSKAHTISSWNWITKRLFYSYDESTPLRLWDEASGVPASGMGVDANGLQSSQMMYDMYRHRINMASVAIGAKGTGFDLMGLLGANAKPFYWDVNGKLSAGKYTMSDIFEALNKIPNKEAILKRLPANTDITYAFDTWLIARRVQMMYQERGDVQTEIRQIIQGGMADFRDMMGELDPAVYKSKKRKFNKNHVKKLQEAAARWNELNDFISNEGGSVMPKNKNFSDTINAWVNISNGVIEDAFSYDPSEGDIMSEKNTYAAYSNGKASFNKAAKIYDYVNEVYGIRQAVAGGLVGVKTANKWLSQQARYPGYAAFQRYVDTTILSDPEFIKTAGKASVSKLSFSMPYKGSQKSIISPLRSQMAMIYETYRKAPENMIKLRLLRQAQSNPELARGLQLLPVSFAPEYDKKGNVVNLQSVYPNTTLGQVAVQTVRIGGVTRYMVVADQSLVAFFHALTSLNIDVLSHPIYKSFRAASHLFTIATTTAYYPFIVANLSLDQINLALTSRNGGIPVLSTLKNGIAPVLQSAMSGINSKLFAFNLYQKMYPGRTPSVREMNYLEEYLSLGGAQQTMLNSLTDPALQAELEKLYNVSKKGIIPSTIQAAGKTVDLSIDVLSIPSNLSEVLTRLTEYSLARKRGMTPDAAFSHAINITPFYKRGAGGFSRYVTPISPYMRSTLNIFFKYATDAKKHPIRYASYFSGAMLVGFLYVMEMYDEWDDEQKNNMKNMDGKTRAMYLHIPMSTGGMFRLRIPEIMGTPFALGQMTALAMLENKNIDKRQMAQSISSNIPTVINPYEWLASDKRGALESVMRTGISIQNPLIKAPLLAAMKQKIGITGMYTALPMGVDKYPNEYQFRIDNRSTPILAKAVSDMTGSVVSPIEADIILASFGSRVYQDFSQSFDTGKMKTMNVKQREELTLRGMWYNDFYQERDEAQGESKSLMDYTRGRVVFDTESPEYAEYIETLKYAIEKESLYTVVSDLINAGDKVNEAIILNQGVLDVQFPVELNNQFSSVVEAFHDKKPQQEILVLADKAYETLSNTAREVGIDIRETLPINPSSKVENDINTTFRTFIKKLERL